jgi:hypothetical protein
MPDLAVPSAFVKYVDHGRGGSVTFGGGVDLRGYAGGSPRFILWLMTSDFGAKLLAALREESLAIQRQAEMTGEPESPLTLLPLELDGRVVSEVEIEWHPHEAELRAKIDGSWETFRISRSELTV